MGRSARLAGCCWFAIVASACDPPETQRNTPLTIGSADGGTGFDEGGFPASDGCFGGECYPASSDGSTGTGLDDDGSTGDSGATTTTDSTGPEPPEVEVCYPGVDESWTTCFALVEAAPYDYPPPFGPNYDPPLRFLVVADFGLTDLDTPIAPNFLLAELINPDAGTHQVLQPHAVEMLQAVRDIVGPLIVRDAYRSPLYNAGAGGVTNSRHLFGDAFDLEPVEDTPEARQALFDACVSIGADFVEMLEDSNVHCDWRDIPNDPAFFL